MVYDLPLTSEIVAVALKDYYINKILMVPTWTGKPENPGKMRKLFPVREKSGNFEQTGKVREFHPKYWKNKAILPKILEK